MVHQLRAMKITLVFLGRDTGMGQVITIDSRCPPQGTLYVFGDASLKEPWGRTTQLRDASGYIDITMVVHPTTLGLSTKVGPSMKVVDATMIISACQAVNRWLTDMDLDG